MNEFRPEGILRMLDEHGVRYVLIGGMAAVLHGSALPTYDVDSTPEGSTPNLARLSDALRALNARVRVRRTGRRCRCCASYVPGCAGLDLRRRSRPTRPPGAKNTTAMNSAPSTNVGSESGTRSTAGNRSTASEEASSSSRLSR